MKGKMLYETPEMLVIYVEKDIITTSIVDNDGDYRDWESGGTAW